MHCLGKIGPFQEVREDACFLARCSLRFPSAFHLAERDPFYKHRLVIGKICR